MDFHFSLSTQGSPAAAWELRGAGEWAPSLPPCRLGDTEQVKGALMQGAFCNIVSYKLNANYS